MFIFSAKLTKKKLVGAVIAAGAILIAVIFLLTSTAKGADSTSVSTKVRTNDDRLEYIGSLGWEVSAEPGESQEVLIPNEWDDVFEQYNELQQTRDFDLSKYKGKRVMRYTYAVNNYPGEQKNVVINLLCYKNTIIGGDIQSPSLDGFMIGLCKREDISKTTVGTPGSVGKCTEGCTCPNCPSN